MQRTTATTNKDIHSTNLFPPHPTQDVQFLPLSFAIFGHIKSLTQNSVTAFFQGNWA
jgi:hypothetical protein